VLAPRPTETEISLKPPVSLQLPTSPLQAKLSSTQGCHVSHRGIRHVLQQVQSAPLVEQLAGLPEIIGIRRREPLGLAQVLELSMHLTRRASVNGSD
jgi:hypothetical protein